MLDFWWRRWRWDRCFTEYCGFTVQYHSICVPYSYKFIYHRGCKTSAIDSIVKCNTKKCSCRVVPHNSGSYRDSPPPSPRFLLYMTPCWGYFVGEVLQFESLRFGGNTQTPCSTWWSGGMFMACWAKPRCADCSW